MRIGIDIDGVLTNLEEYLFENGIKHFREKGINLKNPNGYEIKGMFEVVNEEQDTFWEEYVATYFSLPARHFAARVIDKLRSEGNEIYIITARGAGKDEKMLGVEETQFITKAWLMKNNIKYDKIIFDYNGKVDVCVANNIDVMIEDMPKNLENISKKIKCIAFDARYNKDVNNENIIRCYSWYDIYYTIKDLRNNS